MIWQKKKPKTQKNYLSVGYMTFVKYCPGVLYIWTISSSRKGASTEWFENSMAFSIWEAGLCQMKKGQLQVKQFVFLRAVLHSTYGR